MNKQMLAGAMFIVMGSLNTQGLLGTGPDEIQNDNDIQKEYRILVESQAERPARTAPEKAKPLIKEQVVRLEATGYTCGPESTGKDATHPDYCRTASGYVIKPGDKVVAMGKKYAFGTSVTIPGYGKATVRDRGGAVGNDQIDLYFDQVEEALKWGRRSVTVTVEMK